MVSAKARDEISHEEIERELVIPAFHDFCRQQDLPFEFLYEPDGTKHLTPTLDEMELQAEAMKLFNKLRPTYYYFRGKVVSFRFTVWGGGFESEVWSIEEFIEEMNTEKRRLDELQSKHKYVAYASIIALSLIVFTGLTILTSLFIEKPMARGYLGIAALVLSGLSVYYFEKKCVRINDSAPEITHELVSIRDRLYRIRKV